MGKQKCDIADIVAYNKGVPCGRIWAVRAAFPRKPRIIPYQIKTPVNLEELRDALKRWLDERNTNK